MGFKLITATARRQMPWKNGGGTTFEIASYPEDADLAAFEWRVSMAQVVVDGPFSVFPYIDRTICILDGVGSISPWLGASRPP